MIYLSSVRSGIEMYTINIVIMVQKTIKLNTDFVTKHRINHYQYFDKFMTESGKMKSILNNSIWYHEK